MADLKEWQKHIAHPHADKMGKALCGADIGLEFHLTGLDHAFNCIELDNRTQPCPKCAAVAVEAFTLKEQS